MLLHHGAYADGRTPPTITERGPNRSLNLYVDLGIRPSSITLFSELGIDLYVDLPIISQSGGGRTEGGKRDSNEISSECGDLVQEHLDLSTNLCIEDSDGPLEHFRNTGAILSDGMTTGPGVSERFTATDLEGYDGATKFVVTDVSTNSETANACETWAGAKLEHVDISESFRGADVENVDAIETYTDTDVENVDVLSLQNVQLPLFSSSQKGSDGRDNWSWGCTEMETTFEQDVWDDAEIGAIHGLTKLRDALKYQPSKWCSGGGAEFSTGGTPSLDKMRESMKLPDDELYHLRLHLEYLSKRVKHCRASVQQPKSASEFKSMKPWRRNVCKDGQTYPNTLGFYGLKTSKAARVEICLTELRDVHIHLQ
ncbi:hypothetical protein AXG93_3303s1000 [Marchantia polymorpha subsp. ruderalis]|uniref:Uncharacterized protein n=1 Tax=Marchantia polymorpha subsp. ruderalis TaxID=1480154 RepID=A0A176WFL2_MARPO|nr:hypothetical protein AXG93_3303s1000 [Marchantia polymorpha subsp. ruderalis]